MDDNAPHHAGKLLDPESRQLSPTDSVAKSDLDNMGYVAELPRHFGLLSVFGIGYSICGAPAALLLSLGVIIGSGGQATIIWGQFLIYIVAACVAVSLAELASAYPNAGGQYYWAAVLAPTRIRRVFAYIVGNLSWLSSVFMTASVLVAVAEMAVAMYALTHPDATTSTWNVFVTYQLVNIVMFTLNCFERYLAAISRFWLTMCLSAAVCIFVSILACAPSYQPASFVFTGFTNLSGWSDGMAFLTGLLGVNWGFSCLDAVTHMAEEIPDPRRNIPKALLGTVAVNAMLAWPMAIAIMFCIQSVDDVFDASTGLSSLNFFVGVFQNSTAGPLGLQSLLFLGGLGSIFGIQTWQARLAWTVARDGGTPFHTYVRRIAPEPFGIPFWAHVYSTVCVAIVGCLYMGSSVAFNAFVSGGILLQYLVYSICVIFLLIRGRSSIPHGPFWTGKLGFFCNIVVIGWTAFTLIFYSFPPYLPVTLTNMNYVSVVVVGFAAFFGMYYIVWGRRSFTGPPHVE